jgi:hypothetical protein
MKSKMNDIILSSPCIPKENEEWPTPMHAIICGMSRLGFSQRDIVQRTSAKDEQFEISYIKNTAGEVEKGRFISCI